MKCIQPMKMILMNTFLGALANATLYDHYMPPSDGWVFNETIVK